MIDAAERDGKITKNTILVEPTSGNTGIALAMIASRKGYRVAVVLPDNVTRERRQLLRLFGARIIERLLRPLDDFMDIAAVPRDRNAADRDRRRHEPHRGHDHLVANASNQPLGRDGHFVELAVHPGFSGLVICELSGTFAD
jgi:hypothetical protein